MKGLLLKDWYMLVKYCRMYFLIAIVFLATSLFNSENMFLVVYPCLFCGMIPMTLLSYDERSKWLQYSEMLPSTRAQYVSAKYLIGLIPFLLILVTMGIAHSIRMVLTTGFDGKKLAMMLGIMLLMAFLSSSICLPPALMLGVEKGRIMYYLMIAVVCFGGVVSTSILQGKVYTQLHAGPSMLLVPLAAIVLYAVSWYLSIRAYEKREL